MQNTFTIQQNVSFAELFRAALYILLTSPFFKRLVLTIVVLMLFSIITGVLTTNNNFTWLTLLQHLAPVIILILFFCVFMFLGCLVLYKIKPQNFKGIVYEFNHWGMTKMVNGKEYTRPWRSFSHMRETKNFFLLYISKMDAHFIQKRLFENDEEIENFRVLLKENISYR